MWHASQLAKSWLDIAEYMCLHSVFKQFIAIVMNGFQLKGHTNTRDLSLQSATCFNAGFDISVLYNLSLIRSYRVEIEIYGKQILIWLRNFFIVDKFQSCMTDYVLTRNQPISIFWIEVTWYPGLMKYVVVWVRAIHSYK